MRYATLQSLGTAGLTALAPASLSIYQYDAKIPSTTQWNVGVQTALPWAMAVDVSYVGNHGYNLLQNTARQRGRVRSERAWISARRTSRRTRIRRCTSTVPGATSVAPI